MDVQVENYAKWIRTRNWDHWVTLTFRDQPTADEAERRFRAFVRRVRALVRGPIDRLGVLAKGAEGRWHIHAFLAGTEGLKVRELADEWRYFGFPHVRIYNEHRGAAEYTAAHLVDDDARVLLPIRTQ